MSALEITQQLLAQAQSQLNKEPTETDIMTLAFSLVPKIEQLAKGQLKGPEKMDILLGVLDGALNMCNQEVVGPLRTSLRDRIVPAVSGLINASHSGDVSLGIASAVALTTEVVAVASKGCFCFGKKAVATTASAPVETTATATSESAQVELPPLPPSPSKE
jgi:hypothetical protein